MKSSSKRSITLLGSLALLIGAMVIYSFLIRPEYEIVNSLRAEVEGKSQLLAEQQAVIAQVESLLNQFQGSARIQETVSLSLPPKEDTSGIFSQLQTLAQANNLRIDVFGVQEQPTKPPAGARGTVSVVHDVGVMRVTLKVSGAYENFKNFLQAIETNIRIMDVVSLRVEKVLGSYNHNLVLQTYYQTD